MTFRVDTADCLLALPLLAASSVDAIVTDPPFGTSGDGKGRRAISGAAVVEFGHEWDRELPLTWLPEAARVLRPGAGALVFTDSKRLGVLWDAGARAGLHPLHTFYWEKPDPPPNPRKNFASAIEGGVFFRKPGRVLHWGGGGWCRNVFRAPLAHKEHDGQTRYHPTEKPVSLMRWLVTRVAGPGMVVLDPFCGSGSTGVACVREGIAFIGIEQKESYAAIARQRLHEASMQPSLPMGACA